MKRNQKKKFKKIFKLLILIVVLLIITLFARLYLKKITFFNSLFLKKSSSDYVINPNSDTAKISDFEKKLRDRKIYYNNIKENLDTGTIEVLLGNGITVIFSKFKDIEWQINSLQSIISKLTIEDRIPKKIDFTYEKTIVNL